MISLVIPFDLNAFILQREWLSHSLEVLGCLSLLIGSATILVMYNLINELLICCFFSVVYLLVVGGTLVSLCTCRVQKTSCWSCFSFYHVGYGDSIQALRLDTMYLYLLGHVRGLRVCS